MNFEDDRLQPIQSADFDLVLEKGSFGSDPFHRMKCLWICA